MSASRRLAVALAAFALAGCTLDDVAMYTGVGADPEGVVHGYLWALARGDGAERYWREPEPGQTVPHDHAPHGPTKWRWVLHHEGAGKQWATDWALERFWVRGKNAEGSAVEGAWDFCLSGRPGPHRLLGVWPGADDGAERCSRAPLSAAYRAPPSDGPSRDPRAAARARARAKVVLARDWEPTLACDLACAPTASERDCDLCVCVQTKVPAGACAGR